MAPSRRSRCRRRIEGRSRIQPGGRGADDPVDLGLRQGGLPAATADRWMRGRCPPRSPRTRGALRGDRCEWRGLGSSIPAGPSFRLRGDRITALRPAPPAPNIGAFPGLRGRPRGADHQRKPGRRARLSTDRRSKVDPGGAGRRPPVQLSWPFAETPTDAWFISETGVARVARRELAETPSPIPMCPLRPQVFDAQDGFRRRLGRGVRCRRGAAAPDGRVWFHDKPTASRGSTRSASTATCCPRR